jgi:hypothetical protein
MAGENVTEGVVRKVFGQGLDVVVHVDRDARPWRDEGIRRQVTEIVAVAPSLGDDFTCEPIFVRDGIGRPIEWTGALPPDLEDRVDRVLPRGTNLRSLVERGGVPS